MAFRNIPGSLPWYPKGDQEIRRETLEPPSPTATRETQGAVDIPGILG